MIILDESFNSVVGSAKWGRNIVACLRKYLQFHLTVIISAVTNLSIACIFLGDSSLRVDEIIWIIIFFGVLMVFGFANEPPSE